VLQQRVTIVKRRQALIRDKPGRLAQLRVSCTPPWTRPKSEAGHVAPMADVETAHFCAFSMHVLRGVHTAELPLTETGGPARRLNLGRGGRHPSAAPSSSPSRRARWCFGCSRRRAEHLRQPTLMSARE
jgi:hypothetical protein